MTGACDIIRSGDLTPGKRYRLLEVLKHADHPAIGEIAICSESETTGTVHPKRARAGCWLFVSEKCGRVAAGAVELVEDEVEQPDADTLAQAARDILRPDVQAVLA